MYSVHWITSEICKCLYGAKRELSGVWVFGCVVLMNFFKDIKRKNDNQLEVALRSTILYGL